MWPLLLALACSGDDTGADSSASDDTATPTTTGDDTGTDTVGDNTAPTCAITGPEDGSFGEEGDPVTFLGTADDAEQSAPGLSVLWHSDKDGDLGTAAPTSGGDVVLSTDDLSAATHVITLSVTDDGDEICSDFILYSVGGPPTAVITGPGDDGTVDAGDEVSFTAQISDDATDALDLAVVWSSDLDGGLDSGGADSSGAVEFATTTLSMGRHSIELLVTDEDGLFSIDTLVLTVNGVPSAPTISLTPADPDTTDDLVVSVDADSTDPDGDPISYDYTWSLFGTASGESTDARLPADATSRGDTWTVTVTPRDDRSDGEAAEASASIGNAAPSLTGASIAPNPASADDTLTCTGEGFSDPDGDSDQSTWSWSVDGTEIGTASTQTGGFGGDDTVTCAITPHDGTDAGTPVSAVTAIGNTAPSIATASISPNPAGVGDALTCVWAGFVDPDGDADESFVAWTVNGTSAGSGTTLSSGFVGTDTVTCTVTPFDGASTGTPVDASLTVTNAVPSLTSATITPNPAVAGDTLVCLSAGWADDDGHSDQSAWAWHVNGSEVGTDTSLASGFVGGDLVACTVTPDDGTDTGTAVSDSLIIDNSAPSVSDVAIDPSSAVSGDTLTCTWTFSDADGDSDQSTVAWTLNSSPAGTSDTLSTTLAQGDVVKCTVTPSDGTDSGTAASASLTVSNSPPSITGVTVSPSSATAADGLTCTWSGYSDPDGDADASTLLWTVNSSSAGTDTSLTGGYVGGDTVTCTVTPGDGSTTGDPLSDGVTIDNTPPVLGAVTVTPTAPDASETLTCEVGSTTDIDGTTSFTYTYDWTVNGSSGAGSSATLAGAFVRGNAVTCAATPNDGTDDGDPLTSGAVTIANAPPEISGISLSPTSPDTLDVVVATVTSTDVDGDSVSVSYTWTVDGSEVSGETSDGLDGDLHFDKGQEITVEVVPNDGTDDGDASTSSTLTVNNTAPTAPTVDISPEDPGEGSDDLVCEVTDESTDVDGDAITYSAAWTVDGSVWTGSTSTTSWSGDTIDASKTTDGEIWECTMTPDDGDDDGDTATDSVTISGAGTCSNMISAVSAPTTIRNTGTTYGTWFPDPLETLGAGLLWSMDGHYGSQISEYASQSAYSSDSPSSTYSLPSDWDGTGAQAYNGYLYYVKVDTNTIVKMDLSSHAEVASMTLSAAGYRNTCSWGWGGWSDIDIEVDEQGLWVVYGETSSSCNIAFAKLDEDLNIQATYSTNAGNRGSYGNAWMTDGILYVTDSYSDSSSSISYAYDSCTGVDWDPGIPFNNAHGYNASIHYNPTDQLLYSWDSSHQVTYSLTF